MLFMFHEILTIFMVQSLDCLSSASNRSTAAKDDTINIKCDSKGQAETTIRSSPLEKRKKISYTGERKLAGDESQTL